MTSRRPLARAVAALAATTALSLALGMAGPPAVAAKGKPVGKPAGPVLAQPEAGSLTVMTRNLYLGGDIGRPVRATDGLVGWDALTALGNANDELWDIVVATDFPTRSKLLAREIATTAPDMVGLQEAALWRVGPFDQGAGMFASNAEGVVYDFLETLLDDLKALGVPYEAVESQVQSDVEGPAFTGDITDPASLGNPRDIRLTMRDALLRRVDSPASVVASDSDQYLTRLNVPGLPYSFIRGYNWADVELGDKTVRVINTHLESQYSVLAAWQAQELLNGPAMVEHPVVIVCDCNSDPLDGSQKEFPDGTLDAPHWTAYQILTGLGGFHDAWLQVAPAEKGWTSGLSETVNEAPGQAFKTMDHRIDLVLTRDLPAAVSGTIVGVHPTNRAQPSGLWPSDHAGVVVTLQP
jgi:endonuclease/exonuclease/phosphatase family metal-dependent hydrolase